MAIKVSTNFINEVETIRKEKRIDSIIDAIVLWCEKNGCDIEYAATLVKKDSSYKGLIEQEAINLNVLKR